METLLRGELSWQCEQVTKPSPSPGLIVVSDVLPACHVLRALLELSFSLKTQVGGFYSHSRKVETEAQSHSHLPKMSIGFESTEAPAICQRLETIKTCAKDTYFWRATSELEKMIGVSAGGGIQEKSSPVWKNMDQDPLPDICQAGRARWSCSETRMENPT